MNKAARKIKTCVRKARVNQMAILIKKVLLLADVGSNLLDYCTSVVEF